MDILIGIIVLGVVNWINDLSKFYWAPNFLSFNPMAFVYRDGVRFDVLARGDIKRNVVELEKRI
jgi:hypothetical protein